MGRIVYTIVGLMVLTACGSNGRTNEAGTPPVYVERQAALRALPQETGQAVSEFTIQGSETVFRTPAQKAELINWIPITGPGQEKQFKTILAVRLLDIREGDILHFNIKGQVTNDVGFNIMVTETTWLSASPSWDDRFTELTEGSGTNVNPERHHHKITDAWTHQFDRAYSDVYLIFVVRSASSLADGTQLLEVDQDYGGISGSVRRYE